ncbi:DNA topoisomerase 6 subunit B [Capsicum chinense]|nr:DNA topoisomerase 6 subunit B [Capsicum chinense]
MSSFKALYDRRWRSAIDWFEASKVITPCVLTLRKFLRFLASGHNTTMGHESYTGVQLVWSSHMLTSVESPAEFFADNKNIAGFDNPGKCLYTTVRELVENALDSAESISNFPVVEITIEEIGRSKFNSMIGLSDHERRDEALYDDFETAKAREKRLAKEARVLEIQAKNAALGKKVKDPAATKAAKGREAAYYRVTCKDNGRGMPHDDIPNMFGRVLSGTKYGLKQTRGKFGLGAKMALIWSKMSTGLPIEIASSMKSQNYTSFCRLDIDIHKNVPHIHVHEKRENKDRWHGAEIQIVIEGNWTTYRSKILHYMRQMAVITPYAQFLFQFVSDSPEKNVTVRFTRRTDIMPPVPLETKYHPSAVDILLIKRLITETSKQTLLQFLQHEFVNIGKSHAERLIVADYVARTRMRVPETGADMRFRFVKI